MQQERTRTWKLWEKQDYRSLLAVNCRFQTCQTIGDLRYKRTWNLGKKKEDDESVLFYTLFEMGMHRGGRILAGKKQRQSAPGWNTGWCVHHRTGAQAAGGSRALGLGTSQLTARSVEETARREAARRGQGPASALCVRREHGQMHTSA